MLRGVFLPKMREMRNAYSILLENLKIIYYLEDPGVDGTITLKCNLNNLNSSHLNAIKDCDAWMWYFRETRNFTNRRISVFTFIALKSRLLKAQI